MCWRSDSFHRGQIETRVSVVGEAARRQKKKGGSKDLKAPQKGNKVWGPPGCRDVKLAARQRPSYRTWADDRQQQLRLGLSGSAFP